MESQCRVRVPPHCWITCGDGGVAVWLKKRGPEAANKLTALVEEEIEHHLGNDMVRLEQE